MSTTMKLQETQSGTWNRVKNAVARRTEGRAVILLILVVGVIAVQQPIVFNAYGVSLARVALVGLVALGPTLVVLQGELDLSVGSTLALTGVVVASIPDLGLGIIAGLVTGVVIGALNAFLIVVVGVNSFIATLGTLFALRGLAFVLSDGRPVRVTDIDSALLFGRELLGPITPRVLIFILLFIILQVFISRMRAGREFYAVGGNRQAAIDAGIPVKLRLFTSFMLCGFVAALAGVINTLELTAADPTAGSTVLLASFAAVIIGGNLLNGGRGSLVGTLIGAFALGLMQVGLTFAGADREVQDVLIGIVLLVAITTDPNNLRALSRRLQGLVRGKAHSQA